MCQKLEQVEVVEKNNTVALNRFFRIIRSQQFGLDERWLLMADLEQREKRRITKTRRAGDDVSLYRTQCSE